MHIVWVTSKWDRRSKFKYKNCFTMVSSIIIKNLLFIDEKGEYAKICTLHIFIYVRGERKRRRDTEKNMKMLIQQLIQWLHHTRQQKQQQQKHSLLIEKEKINASTATRRQKTQKWNLVPFEQRFYMAVAEL